jgi:predicted AAA+ superfamily ATPase
MAIEWLKDSGLIKKVTRITKPGLPLGTYALWQDFKIYLNDTGLLCAMADLSPEILLKGNSLFSEFKGILTEQYVIQTLTLNNIPGYYWNPENTKAEVDFVIQQKDNVIPVEVKSAENVKSRSLRVYYDKYEPKKCIRTSLAGYKKQEWMTNIPLYALDQWLSGKVH